jgi:DNA-binding NarL/FixJ family response regulator
MKMVTGNKYKILIVDDHPIIRQGLVQFISERLDLTVCAEASHALEAMEILKTIKPDIVIVDISLKEINGIELIKRIKVEIPSLPTLVFSMHEELLYAERVIHAGARGYVMKQADIQTLITAIYSVINGEIYLSEPMKATLMNKLFNEKSNLNVPFTDKLSDREFEIFQLFGNGLTTKEIANTLNLSPNTINTHREHIKKKLNIKSTNELMLQAVNCVNDI